MAKTDYQGGPDDTIKNSISDSSSNAQAPGRLDNSQANASISNPVVRSKAAQATDATPTMQAKPGGNLYNHPAGVSAALAEIEQVPDISNTSRPAIISSTDPNRWTYVTKSGVKRRMTPRQIAVIQEYMANGGNGTQAVLSAGYNQDYQSAKVTAARLLSTANQHGIIAQEMELAGIGRPVQMGALSDVIHGRYLTSDTQEYVDEDGKVYRKVITKRKPTARDVVSAISTADRISGAKEARRVQADAVSAEMKALFKRYSPAQALKDVSEVPVECPTMPQGLPTNDSRDGGIDDSDLGVLGLTTEQVGVQPDSKDSVSACTTSDTNEHERAWSTWAGEGEGGNGRGS